MSLYQRFWSVSAISYKRRRILQLPKWLSVTIKPTFNQDSTWHIPTKKSETPRLKVSNAMLTMYALVDNFWIGDHIQYHCLLYLICAFSVTPNTHFTLVDFYLFGYVQHPRLLYLISVVSVNTHVFSTWILSFWSRPTPTSSLLVFSVSFNTYVFSTWFLSFRSVSTPTSSPLDFYLFGHVQHPRLLYLICLLGHVQHPRLLYLISVFLVTSNTHVFYTWFLFGRIQHLRLLYLISIFLVTSNTHVFYTWFLFGQVQHLRLLYLISIFSVTSNTHVFFTWFVFSVTSNTHVFSTWFLSFRSHPTPTSSLLDFYVFGHVQHPRLFHLISCPSWHTHAYSFWFLGSLQSSEILRPSAGDRKCRNQRSIIAIPNGTTAPSFLASGMK